MICGSDVVLAIVDVDAESKSNYCGGYLATPLVGPCSVAIRPPFAAGSSNGGGTLVATGRGGSNMVAVSY